MTEEDLKKKPAKKKATAKKSPADPMVGKPCPLYGKVVVVYDKTAYC